MAKAYSQFSAFKALLLGALRSMLKSPSSVIFTAAFPLVFILVFGFIGNDRGAEIKVIFSEDTDETLPLVRELKAAAFLKLMDGEAGAVQMLEKGQVDAILELKPPLETGPVRIRIQTAGGEAETLQMLEMEIRKIIEKDNPDLQAEVQKHVVIDHAPFGGRRFQAIDFILPGQLGFSLLAASVFGTAFVFFTLRQDLVLKRFFASPVRRWVMLLAEGVARMLFQLLGAFLILVIGWCFLGYTLTNGWVTLLNLLLLSAIGILVFMSFGFIISGIAKSASSIPPISNIFVLPQFLLAGTFFAVEVLPGWLQPVSQLMPLTYLNTAFRAVAFDGASFWEVKGSVFILLLWGTAGYLGAARLFRWE